MQRATGGTPESVANELNGYVWGWADAAEELAAGHVDALAASLRTATCNASAGDAELIVYSRIAARFSHPSMRDALDCILRQRTTEDVVLWAALDAYRADDLEPSEEWRSWAARATDERTRRRFAEAAGLPSGRRNGGE